MKKNYLSLIVALIAILGVMDYPVNAVAKSSTKNQQDLAGKRDLIEVCFKFTGTRNLEEGDVTKWEKVTTVVCASITCTGFLKGCKMKVTCTQIINGIERPCNVYLIPGTNTPTTGPTVTSVQNAD